VILGEELLVECVAEGNGALYNYEDVEKVVFINGNLLVINYNI